MFSIYFSDWLRLNCMSVFHYCAEILKETPLFETCKDSHILKPSSSKEGAIYNNFDGLSERLMRDSDFEEENEDSTNSNNEDSELILEEPTVTQSDIDDYFIQSDDVDESRWKKDHPLFSCNNDTHFKTKVDTLINLRPEEWKKLPIYDIDLER